MEKLQNMLAEILARDPAALPSPSTPLKQIDGWDSLKHVMLVVRIEQSFGASLSAEEIRSMVSLADVARVLQEKGIDV